MGFFEVFCDESKLVLAGETRLILVAMVKERQWQPVAIPLSGCYDRYGRIDIADKLDENEELVLQFLARCETQTGTTPSETKLYDLLEERLTEDSLFWKGNEIAYALIDNGIFDGVCQTVAAGGKPEWEPYRNGVLESNNFNQLFESAFALPEIARAIYEPLAGRETWMRKELIDLSRFRAWGGQLNRIDIYDEGGGQFTGYSEQINNDGGAEPYCNAARKKYADFPLILAAVEKNANKWKLLDED